MHVLDLLHVYISASLDLAILPVQLRCSCEYVDLCRKYLPQFGEKSLQAPGPTILAPHAPRHAALPRPVCDLLCRCQCRTTSESVPAYPGTARQQQQTSGIPRRHYGTVPHPQRARLLPSTCEKPQNAV